MLDEIVYVDMHVHTDFCDGATPDEIAEEVERQNALMKQTGENARFGAVAITDHHEVRGIEAVMDAAERRGINLEVVPSIELTTLQGWHILGYFINYKDENLFNELMRIQDGRRKRTRKSIKGMQKFFYDNDIGIEISSDSVIKLTKNENIAGGHIELQIFKHLERLYENQREVYKNTMRRFIGAINSFHNVNIDFNENMVISEKNSDAVKFIKEDCVRKYILSRGGSAYVERTSKDCLSVEEAISLIKSVEGVPGAAHPGETDKDGEIASLKKMGVETLEVYSTKHTPVQNANYARRAIELGLVMTAGTDWHGEKYTPHITLGRVGIMSQGEVLGGEVFRPGYNIVKNLKKRKREIYAT